MASEWDPSGHAEPHDRLVLVLGATGQLGEVIAAAIGHRWRTLSLTRQDLDLARTSEVRRTVHELRPHAIVNCVAYNDVDGAEDAPVHAIEINAIAVRALARAAAEIGAVLVHYSSDFVFDGKTTRPYRETDLPEPQSVYASSKLLGEWFAADAPAHYVLRVESLFGGTSRRKSTLDRIIDSIASGTPVRVFVDRVVSPSYVWDIAEATADVLRLRPTPGIYHCVNTGHATWHDLAVEVARQLRVEPKLEPMKVGDLPMRAPRPRFCALSNEKLRATGISMPPWEHALARALDARALDNRN